MRSFLSLSLAAAIVGITATAGATTIFVDGFAGATEGLNVTAAGNFTAINGTNVDVLGASYPGYCTTVAQCVDIGGSGGANPFGNLQSNSQFAAGTYTLNFVVTGDKRGSSEQLHVTFGDYDQLFNLTSSSVDTVSATVHLAAAGYLEFDYELGSGNGNVGPILNSVSVDTVNTTTTPEPSSLVLLGTGLLSTVGMIRRRKA